MADSQFHRRALLAAGGSTLVFSLAGCIGTTGDEQWDVDDSISVASATQYSNPGCNCCDEYASYLEDHLETDLSVTVADDIDAVKREHGVPDDLQSCHTVVLDDYVVEGHVPVEVILELVDEGPAIDGIALPEMPRGSPGMPGEKDEPFVVYELDGDRTAGREHDVFLEL